MVHCVAQQQPLASTTGLIENRDYKNDAVTIFPNPFHTQTTLQTAIPLTNATLVVENCFGQTVMQINNISSQMVVLSRNNLVNGLYIVRLTQDEQVIATKKLLITE